MTVSVWHIAPGSWQHGAGDYFCKYVREGSLDMPDMALCRNRGCSSKEHCYRFTAELSGHQIHARFDPRGRDRCGYYIPTKMTEPAE